MSNRQRIQMSNRQRIQMFIETLNEEKIRNFISINYPTYPVNKYAVPMRDTKRGQSLDTHLKFPVALRAENFMWPKYCNGSRIDPHCDIVGINDYAAYVFHMLEYWKERFTSSGYVAKVGRGRSKLSYKAGLEYKQFRKNMSRYIEKRDQAIANTAKDFRKLMKLGKTIELLREAVGRMMILQETFKYIWNTDPLGRNKPPKMSTDHKIVMGAMLAESMRGSSTAAAGVLVGSFNLNFGGGDKVRAKLKELATLIISYEALYLATGAYLVQDTTLKHSVMHTGKNRAQAIGGAGMSFRKSRRRKSRRKSRRRKSRRKSRSRKRKSKSRSRRRRKSRKKSR